MDLGQNIAKYRKLNNLTQEKFADELNVSRQTVYKWEASLRKPKLDKLKKIIEILKITYEDLLE